MTTEQITDIPQTATFETKTERDAAIIVACKTRSVRDVANEFGIKENSVYNILARCGVSMRTLRKRNAKPAKAKMETRVVKSNVETPDCQQRRQLPDPGVRLPEQVDHPVVQADGCRSDDPDHGRRLSARPWLQGLRGLSFRSFVG